MTPRCITVERSESLVALLVGMRLTGIVSRCGSVRPTYREQRGRKPLPTIAANVVRPYGILSRHDPNITFLKSVKRARPHCNGPVRFPDAILKNKNRVPELTTTPNGARSSARYQIDKEHEPPASDIVL